MSSSAASSVTATGSGVMISWTLRPWERVYSSASRPGPIRNSSQRGRRRVVPVSARRRKSPSVTMPTSPPSFWTTGNPLTRRCSMIRMACRMVASGSTDMTGDVITSLAFMTADSCIGSLPVPGDSSDPTFGAHGADHQVVVHRADPRRYLGEDVHGLLLRRRLNDAPQLDVAILDGHADEGGPCPALVAQPRHDTLADLRIVRPSLRSLVLEAGKSLQQVRPADDSDQP